MFLSRLILNPYSWHVKRDISNCHELHRTILSAFPEDVKTENEGVRAHFDVLYRLLSSRNENAFTLIVQSAVKPNWSNLPEEYLLYENNGAKLEIKNISKVLKIIKKGMVVKFRLMANPTKKIDGHRVPLYGYKNRLEWLERKGNSRGFDLLKVKFSTGDTLTPDVITHTSVKVIGWKKKKKTGKKQSKKHQLTFIGIIFDGYLKIMDKNKFIEALKKGIGSGKSYGFGLLSIAPG